jgi:hypothetical protein
MIRVTPGVHVHTHDFIATGQDDSKFGFNLRRGDAAAAVERAAASDAMNLIGVHCHIGSNVFDAENFARAVEVMAQFAEPLGLEHLVLGGGLGVAYVEGEQAASLSEWGAALLSAAADLKVRSAISVEPGRSIVAAAAITVYEVGTIKEISGLRTYVAVDGGMSDNIRTSLYGATYDVRLVSRPSSAAPVLARIVGKHCESGDIVVRGAWVPDDVTAGDLLLMSTSFMQPELLAVKLAGPERQPAIAWRKKKGAPTMSSPLVVDDLVYMVSDKGVGSCLEAGSGEPVWSERLGGNFSSSPLFADGRIYVGNRDGDTFVIEPGRTYELLATTHLDGGVYATPAAVGRAIFLRTETALYRIEKPQEARP